MTTALRTVVWSTGGVGSIAVDAIRRRPDLDLVGVWVHSDAKVGTGRGRVRPGIDAIGVVATNDADALIALRPDCVVYAASGPERDAGAVPDYLRLLAGGNQRCVDDLDQLGVPARVLLARVARPAPGGGRSRATCRSTRPGVFPGFRVGPTGAAARNAVEDDPQCVTVTEVALNDHYPVADVMMNGMGFGRPLDFEPMLKTPGFIEMAWQGTDPPDCGRAGRRGVRGTGFARPAGLTDRDIEVAFGTIPGRYVRCGEHHALLAWSNGREAIVDRAHHPDGARRRARLAVVRVRRYLSRRHRG